VHQFHVPQKSRASEGWAIVGVLALMLALLYLVI
jgi:hypothetical protein